MGLDSVELLVTIEKAFGISIPDLEAENILTVGDLYNAVWDKIDQKESQKCTSAILFYRLRKHFEHRYNLKPRIFDLETNLKDIIPHQNRREEWQILQRETGLKFPELKLQKWARKTLLTIGLITIGGGVITALFASSGLYWLVPPAGIVATILISKAFQPFMTLIDEKDIREFVEKIKVLNYSQLQRQHGSRRKEVEQLIDYLIHDRTGVEYSLIKPEAKIVADLGID